MIRNPADALLTAMQAAEADPRVTEDSQVVSFLGRVWNAWPGRSYPQINRSMRRALECAIMIGMKFEKDDIAVIAKRFRWGYWATNPEALYALAAVGLKSHTGRLPCNISAAQSFERYWNRPPYILNGLRLVVGSGFAWENEHVSVTTLAPDGMISCAYHYGPTPEETAAKALAKLVVADLKKTGREELETLLQRSSFDGEVIATALIDVLAELRTSAWVEREGTRKIKRRFTITRAELKAAEKAAREAGRPIQRSDP